MIEDLPPLGASAAFQDSVLARVPAASDFEVTVGDNQLVDTQQTIRGRIWAHKKAHVHGLQHGKVLARIEVSADYSPLGLRTGLNYWIVASAPDGYDPPAGARPDYVSVFIPAAGESIAIRPLYTNTHEHPRTGEPRWTHAQAAARWIVNSDAMPWATCGTHMCCCASSGCDPM